MNTKTFKAWHVGLAYKSHMTQGYSGPMCRSTLGSTIVQSTLCHFKQTTTIYHVALECCH